MKTCPNPPLPSTHHRCRRKHAQTRTALLGFLHGKGFFGEVSKLLGGVRPGSGVALPAVVVESIVGLLTQVRTGDVDVVVVMVMVVVVVWKYLDDTAVIVFTDML